MPATLAQALSVDRANAELTRPGSPFEIATHGVGESRMRMWKNGPQTLGDVLKAVARFDGREFLVFEQQRVTYADFRRAVSTLGTHFNGQGAGKGDVVAVVMPNRPEWIIAWFAAAAAGAICAPMNPASSDDDLRHMLEVSGARIVVCDGPQTARVCSLVAGGSNPPQVIAANVDNDHSGAQRLEDVLGPSEAWRWLPDPGVPAAVSPDDGAAIFFTAGTTGRSKGVLLSHRACAYSVFHSSFRNARRFRLAGKPVPSVDPLSAAQAVHLLPIPLFHVSGSLNSILPQMMRGARIVMMRFWAAEFALRLIESESVTYVGGVPIIAEQILAHPSFRKYSHASLEHIVYGGAPCSPSLAQRLRDQGITPTQNFGMTETAGAITGHAGREYLRNPESCGLAAPIHDVRVVDAAGKVLPPGHRGELQVRGPQIMMKYWGEPDLTAEVLKDGWLRTGDIAHLDEEGYCFIVDRAKDMIISAGENIFCSEIENVLAGHPCVQDVAALGIPHATLGEQPVAVVVLAEGAQLSEPDLRAFARERLSSFKVPALVAFSHEPLPRNAIGKVRKNELKQMF